MKIVSLGGVCIFPDHIKLLERRAKLIFYPDSPRDTKTIISRMDSAEIIISALTKITPQIMDSNKNLKLISLATTGCDDVDLQAARERKITVTYTPGYATDAVAEHTIGLMLASARLAASAANDLKAGIYDPCIYQGKGLKNKTLGVIGYGRIGRQVAQIAQNGFGMKILIFDKDSSRKDLEHLLRSSDFISLHLPLSDQTRNFIGEGEFALLKDGVVFVNTARGAIVDEAALIKNLKSKKIFAAGLDVLAQEPMERHNPLNWIANVIVTPHIAYNTDESLEMRSQIVTRNIMSFIEGKPQNIAPLCP